MTFRFGVSARSSFRVPCLTVNDLADYTDRAILFEIKTRPNQLSKAQILPWFSNASHLSVFPLGKCVCGFLERPRPVGALAKPEIVLRVANAIRMGGCIDHHCLVQ